MLIKSDQTAIRSYFEDSSNLKGGHADCVVFPEDINSLSEFVRSANEKYLPITVSGGGTGTTGSRIPFGGAVISLEKFNNIGSISKDRRIAGVEAGVTVEDFKNSCEEENLSYASHPTEKTAFIGGTISTNASGARSFKYGPTRNYVKRLKMVLATGEIFEIGRGERTITRNDSKISLPGGRYIKIPIPCYKMPDVKNSAGLFAKDPMDLVDLFIGQEGTLSIICEADIGLTGLPAGILSSFVFFKKDSDSLNFAAEARSLSKSKDKVSAIDALSIEYFDENALDLLRLKNSNVPKDASAAIFFEQESSKDTEQKILDAWLKLILKHNASAEDSWVAMTEEEGELFLKLRHSIPESINDIVRKNGRRKLSTDIAVPEKRFPEMMNFYKSLLKAKKVKHCMFGHIGECHLHVNLFPKDEKSLVVCEDICMEFVKKGISLGGTVSAEHGIGKVRRRYLEVMYGRSGILDMARIKKAFDPNCILNLDNIFPKDILELV